MTPETAQLIRPGAAVARAFDGSWPATPNNVSRSRRALLATLEEHELDARTLEAIGTAVTELATNSVYHAFVGRRIGRFRIAATVTAGEVEIAVEDDGAGFDDVVVRPGRGLALVASVAARVETSGGPGSGTRTTLWFTR